MSEWWARLGLPAGELDELLAADPGRRQRLARVVELAHKVHGEKAVRWFSRPEAALGGALPKTLLRDPAEGPALVEQALRNALHGPFR